MRRPKCDTEMEEIQCEDVTIDRCKGCKGLWFDKGEAASLSERWVAEFIGTGDPYLGAR